MYNIMPIMSFVMAIKGPVAMAGSIFSFSSVIGTSVPKIEANITTANRLMDTEYVTVAVAPKRMKLYVYTNKEMIVALINATTASLVTCLNVFLASSELFASPCTMIAEDCVPTFPPVPPISGI